jgi:protein gp37
MGSKTGIAWCDATWNPWQGCTRVSEGCDNCYMMREKNRYGQDGTQIVRSAPVTFRMPLSRTKVPPGSFVFVCSWSDFFSEDAEEAWRVEALDMMMERRDCTFLLLTKRADRMVEWADMVMRTVPIAGGESGPNARPLHPAWARSLRDQCLEAQVPFFFKQWGEYAPHENVEASTGWKYHKRYSYGSCSPHLIRYASAGGGPFVPAGDGHADATGITMYRLGKARTGRLLDGVEHLARPQGGE